MLALYSVTTAGPEYFFPILKESRAWIVAVNFLPAKTTGAVLDPLPSCARPGAGLHARAIARLACACRDLMLARRRRVTNSTFRAACS